MKIKKYQMVILFLICFGLFTGLYGTQSFAQDSEVLNRLEKVIIEQQKQIEAQAEAIKILQQQVQMMQTTQKESVAAAAPKEESGFVLGRDKNAKVTLYGQVNRGILVSDDGNKTNVYQVDNDNSSTRSG